MESQNLNESQDSLPSMDDILTSLKENASDVWEYLSTKTYEVSKMSFREIWNAAIDKIKDAHQVAVDATSRWFQNADNNLTWAVNTVKEVWSDIVDGWKLAVDATVDAATYVAEWAKNAYDAQVADTADFYEWVDQTYTAAKEWVTEMYASAKDWLWEAYTVAEWTIKSVPDVTLWDVGNTIADAGSYVKDGFSTAYEVTTWTIESVPNVTVWDVGNSLADAWSYIADAVVWEEAVAAEAPVADAKTWADKADFKNNVDKINSFIWDVKAPEGYDVKVTDWVVWVFKWDERIRYFTPDKSENANLLDKAAVQNWVNSSVQNFEKRYYNKK